MKTRTDRKDGKVWKVIITTCLMMVFCISLAPVVSFGADRLVVQNDTAETKFLVTTDGKVGIGTATPEQDLDIVAPNNGLVRLANTTNDTTVKAARMVLRHYNNTQLPVYLFGSASTSTNNFVAFGGGSAAGTAATQIDLYTATDTMTSIGSPRLTVKNNGYVGIGTQAPAHLIQLSGGAYSDGGSWVNASSKVYKDNIQGLKAEDALSTLQGLNPVTFTYKVSPQDQHVGFIAEDVPELVATKGRKGLSSMDVVAVLTKVVQEQQKTIADLKTDLDALKAKMK